MGDDNKSSKKSRRWFLTGGIKDSKKEMVKMLTADGKLVEIDKAVFDSIEKQKVSNKEILSWMKNPSKKDQ